MKSLATVSTNRRNVRPQERESGPGAPEPKPPQSHGGPRRKEGKESLPPAQSRQPRRVRGGQFWSRGRTEADPAQPRFGPDPPPGPQLHALAYRALRLRSCSQEG